ncbi:MAG: right-handed parallel beta-helix repeat-containing protein [Calditrichia bacterium]
MRVFISIQLLILLAVQVLSAGTSYYVDHVSQNGSGTFNNPFNDINLALAAADPGDTVLVMPGLYELSEDVATKKDGNANERILLMAFNSGDRPELKRSGRVLDIKHACFTINGFVLNGDFGDQDLLRIQSGGDHAVIRNCEIKNSVKDGVDIRRADNVLIENCDIHHMLAGTYQNQEDAHGVVGEGQRNLTIRGCNIYYVSGDCFQTDPGRGLPLWNNVLIEYSRLWTGPLPESAAGWQAGEIPGENAVDTKINPDSVQTGYRPLIEIRNVIAYGFTAGYINNRAAFNIKEQVDCRMENIRVFNNEIAFRLRGPGSRGGAHVLLSNCIAWGNDKVFRTEDGIEKLHIYHGTFQKPSGGIYFQNVSGGYTASGFELKNSLFLDEKPADASHASNLLADTTFFVDFSGGDLHLSVNSPAVNAGVDIPDVQTDIEGNFRQPGGYDVGAYERITVTDVTALELPKPDKAALRPNYPNPFNPSTEIQIEVKEPAEVRLTIFDILGRRVKTLFTGTSPAGLHVFHWNGRNDNGLPIESGIYFCRLQTGNRQQIIRMHLLR